MTTQKHDASRNGYRSHESIKKHKNMADANLGLHIASWGFGAEMMYSLNFGFWSSNSFFSPEDVTSGFTGSGGFSLLWGPFVQPCEEKVTVLDSHKIKAQAVWPWQRCQSITMKQQTTETSPWRIEQRKRLRLNRELTTMLRKSEKSVVLLLQQDHPWRK